MRVLARLTRLAASILVFAATARDRFCASHDCRSCEDTSGAVLPGVTVEAASSALIEKVRTAVSDGTGPVSDRQPRAGTYTVTFTLGGFNTVKREGVVLSGSFTAKVDAEMRVGALEETITVTGETPIVDVQNRSASASSTARSSTTSRRAARPTTWRRSSPASLAAGSPIRTWVDRPRPANRSAASGCRQPTGDQIMLRNGVETVGQALDRVLDARQHQPDRHPGG